MNDNNITILNVTKKNKKFIVETTKDTIELDEDTIIQYGVFKDKVFTTEEFEQIILKGLENKSLLKALNYISYQVRSEKEVIDYLKNNQLPSQIIESIIQKLKQLGYLNDERFAYDIFEYESKVKLQGPFYIENKLYKKGINKDLVNAVIQSYTIDLQIENIQLIINKEINKLSKYPVRKQKQLLCNKLIQRGYESSIVFEQVNHLNLVDESDESLQKDLRKLLKKYEQKNLSTQELKSKIIVNLLNKGYEYANIIETFAKFEY